MPGWYTQNMLYEDQTSGKFLDKIPSITCSFKFAQQLFRIWVESFKGIISWGTLNSRTFWNLGCGCEILMRMLRYADVCPITTYGNYCVCADVLLWFSTLSRNYWIMPISTLMPLMSQWLWYRKASNINEQWRYFGIRPKIFLELFEVYV